MSSPAMSLTPGLTLDDPVVHQFLERHHGVRSNSTQLTRLTQLTHHGLKNLRRAGTQFW